MSLSALALVLTMAALLLPRPRTPQLLGEETKVVTALLSTARVANMAI